MDAPLRTAQVRHTVTGAVAAAPPLMHRRPRREPGKRRTGGTA